MKGMIVIFGATGDLMKKKLAPALYNLYKAGTLTEKNNPIVCVGRKAFSQREYLDFLDTSSYVAEEHSQTFHSMIHYVRYDITESIEQLEQQVDPILAGYDTGGNRIFYFALPPSVFEPLTEKLTQSGLLESDGFIRIAYEKPFGSDLESARILNDAVTRCVSESQIYRIDHYLAKELVVELFSFRFSNRILKEIWKSDHIDHMQVHLGETAGVGERSGYYDSYGAIRDMLQNHVMHIIALLAMDEPHTLEADAIRDNKVRAISSLKPISNRDIVLAQYDEGSDAQGNPLKAYRDELERESNTETYLAARLELADTALAGVPIYVRTGKRLDAHVSRIDIILKDTGCRLFTDAPRQNVVTVKIFPDEGIDITLNSKVPGPSYELTDLNLSFCRQCKYGPNTPQAYEVILGQVLKGDQTLFTRWDEVEASWRWIDSILEKKEKGELIRTYYTAGSRGPREADALIAKEGRKWII